MNPKLHETKFGEPLTDTFLLGKRFVKEIT